jgi:hypothetical protein
MNIISINKLNYIIKLNAQKIKETMNTNNFEEIYNTIKNIVFDNLFIIIIFYFLLLPNLFKKHGEIKKINYWIIFATISLVILSYLFKIFFKNFKILRINDCMKKSNHIIFNKTIKPIETFKHLLDKPFHEFYVNTWNGSKSY